MSVATDYDVIVVGYGPTGQGAASILSRLGHRVLAVERYPELYGMPRMCTIDGEGARIVQVAGDVDAALRESTHCKYYDILDAQGGSLMHIDYVAREPDMMGFPGRISMFQPYIEDAMDAGARARDAEVRMGWAATAISQDEERVDVRIAPWTEAAGPGDGAETVTARYVLGADGARSFVRGALGISRKDYGFRDAFMSIDADILRPLPSRFRMSSTTLDPGRTHAFIRIGERRGRFEFLVLPDDDHSALMDEDFAYEWIEATYGLTREDLAIYRLIVYEFEGKLAEPWRAGRVFLMGDAAHLMPPFMGQGACSGLRDAINLSWKLDLVLRGVSDDRLLETYEEERSPHVQVHIEGSVMLANLLCERDPVRAAERDAAYRRGQGPQPPSPQPPLRSGVLHLPDDPDATSVGRLAPQGRVRLGGATGRFDDLAGWGFALLGWELDPAPWLSTAQLRLWSSIRGLTAHLAPEGAPAVEAAVDLDGLYGGFFDRWRCAAVIVRPDFYVFGQARTASEIPDLVDDLRVQLQTGAGRPSAAVSA